MLQKPCQNGLLIIFKLALGAYSPCFYLILLPRIPYTNLTSLQMQSRHNSTSGSSKCAPHTISRVQNLSSSLHQDPARRTISCSGWASKNLKVRPSKERSVGKSKSKCETEVREWSKKKQRQKQSNLDIRSSSKKTLRKRKHTKCTNEADVVHKNRILCSKHDEESSTIKSGGQKKFSKKELFNSTCFSRHIDHDLEMFDQIAQSTSDFLKNSSNSTKPHMNIQSMDNVPSKTRGAIETQQFSLKQILQRTKNVLNNYREKCENLEQSCNFYKKQIREMSRKIQALQLKGSRIAGRSQHSKGSKTSIKKSIHNTKNSLLKSKLSCRLQKSSQILIPSPKN